MARPKPLDPYHRFQFRVPTALWSRLSVRAASLGISINALAIRLVETGLLDSPLNGVITRPPDDHFPWMRDDP